MIDKLFDLLNSKNLFATGYKTPLKMSNVNVCMGRVDEGISYLKKLSDIHETPLLKHRRKTFVIGFITALSSVKKLALHLLTRNVNPYDFVLTYKFSQDHLELLFTCIRGKNGWNDNPDVRQLKSALQKILLRVSNVSSRSSNCQLFEKDVSPIFALKCTKRRSPLSEKFSEEDECKESVSFDLQNGLNSEYKDAVLGYIGGYVVRKLLKSITCDECVSVLINNDDISKNYLSLVSIKDRGGLVYPSEDVFKIISICELAFKFHCSGDDFFNPKINSVKNLKGKITHHVLSGTKIQTRSACSSQM